MKILQLTIVTFFLSSSFAFASSVNLSGWNSEGRGSWALQTGNNSVKQVTNSLPTVFHNNQNSQGQTFSSKITVKQTGDDDYIGFVLGYNTGDLSNSSADYILIDWKQGSQSHTPFGGLAKKGLSISKVNGALDTTSAWTHSNNVTELQRAANLGDTGWADNTSYTFDLIYTASLIELKVNGTTELSLSGLFSNGSFGFYNFSQTNALYGDLTQSNISAVPIPAALFMFAPALLGFIGFRRKANSLAA